MGTGIGYGFSIAMILTYLIKFLFVVFIVGIVGGLVVAAKNYIFTAEDIENFKAPFKSSKKNTTVCSECGKQLNKEWKACPYCGSSKEK